MATSLLVATALTAGGVLAVAIGVNAARATTPPSGSYGQLPTWLPKAKIPVGRVVTASAIHPWLAVQGDTVLVETHGGHVLATAVGPEVPEEGQFPIPRTTPCTFTITFSSASRRLPITGATFTTVDEWGHLHRLKVTTQDGKPIAAAIPRGKTITITLKAVLPTGQGELRWTPAGAKPIVSWDFDVEID